MEGNKREIEDFAWENIDIEVMVLHPPSISGHYKSNREQSLQINKRRQ
jgi:hypothetical protein